MSTFRFFVFNNGGRFLIHMQCCEVASFPSLLANEVACSNMAPSRSEHQPGPEGAYGLIPVSKSFINVALNVWYSNKKRFKFTFLWRILTLSYGLFEMYIFKWPVLQCKLRQKLMTQYIQIGRYKSFKYIMLTLHTCVEVYLLVSSNLQ